MRRLGPTLAALQRGEIVYQQAAAIAQGVADLPDDQASAVERKVLFRADKQTVGQTQRAVRVATESVDPESAAQRHAKALAARSVEVMGQSDGMRCIWATMPASMCRDLWDNLTARAHAQRDERRRLGLPEIGLDALRVDELVHAVLRNGGADPANPRLTIDGHPRAHRRRDGHRCPVSPQMTSRAAHTPAEPSAPHPTEPDTHTSTRANTPTTPSDASGRSARAGGTFRPERHTLAEDGASRPLPRCTCGGAQTAGVVVDLPTLLGLRETPGLVPGHGAVPAQLARDMAADRDWIRWLVDPGSGALMDLGAERYRPSDRLKRFIVARDRTCGFPSCSRPAQLCDCDHIITFRQRGQTTTVNLGPLCRQHHNAKTHGRWKLTYDPVTRIKTWLSPLGKTYDVSADPVLS